ncbi:MATE family efflux transporter [Diaphorobacter ruginosibacter]|uniref:MATE family efflux transporter n=1 Tax=Diaphorobacter ruginosibacter TaxID=1715720 RepID=A0A7G9RNQ4_9BURK|nr:MATE family efflux transporter [Diaphorobacter ruginosibacter]QNN57229.1 MATE family efflux transporter [Diaphorobacter ruginosibacter]
MPDPVASDPSITALPERSTRRAPTRDLTRGPIGYTLFVFSLPILAGNVLQSLNGSVNAMWIGRFLGEAALTATANANNVMFALIGLIFGVGMAATILVAQSMGAHDLAQAKRVLGSSATFFGAASVVIAAAGWPLSRRIMVWMGTPADALPLAEAYLQVIFLAIPLLYLFAFVSAVLRGAGDTRTPFWFLLLVVILDTALNPLLIFGWGPVPRLGMTGSALATFIANAIGFALMLAWLRMRQHPLWIGSHELALFRPDGAIIRALVTKGLPMGAQMVMISLAMIAMISMVNAYGVHTASAYGAALQLWTYVQMPAMAIGAACSSMAAQNVGAQLWDRVEGTARAGVLCNVAMTGTLIALIIAADRYMMGWFLPAGSEAIETARHLNHIAIGSFLFFGVTFVLSGVIRSTGAVIPPLVMLAIAMWGIRVPAAHFLQPYWGADAIWWSFPISAFCSMLMTMAYYRYGNWRKAHMLARAPTRGVNPA